MITPIFLKGEAAFTADGEDYLIALDAEAWLAAERSAGLSLVVLMARMHGAMESGAEPLTGDLAAILHGGLRRNHPGVSFEDALNLLVRHYTAITSALNDAIVASLPQSKDTAGNVKAPAKNGTGSGLSRSGASRGKGSKTSGGQPRA